jgi:glycosyltransferase involved in cell wall biosynthesis
VKILVVTNIFPTPKQPDSGTYVAEQIDSLKSSVKINVVFKSRKSRLGFLDFFLRTLWAMLSTSYDIVHAHYGFHSALLPAFFRRKPLVVTFHGSDALIEPARNKIYGFLQKQVVARASHLVAVSKQIQDRLINELGAEPEKVGVIPCGIDTQLFRFRNREEARNQLGLKHSDRIALFIGRLTYAKGIDLIQEASRHLCEISFYFIGNGLVRWNAPNCFFEGVIEHTEIPYWLNAADVLLLPSRSEGTPAAVLESLASETPVICSAVGACSELVLNGTTGLLIPVDDAHALIRAIQQVFSDVKFDTRRGREMVVQNYDLKIISMKLLDLYSRIVKK